MCAVVLLGATVATAHAGAAGDEMGEAAAMCLAVLAAGAAVVALPALGDVLPQRRAPLEIGASARPASVKRAVPYRSRGDPALLQVFRR